MPFAFINEKRFPWRLFVLMLSGIFGSVSPALGQEAVSDQVKCADVGEPAAWWTFDQAGLPEAVIGSLVSKSSLKGDPAIVQGRIGNALDLRSVGDGIVYEVASGVHGDLTVEAWLRVKSHEGLSELSRWDEVDRGSFVIGLTEGRPSVQLGNGLRKIGEAVLSDGRWHHLAIVVTEADTADILAFLVDGDRVAVSTVEETEKSHLEYGTYSIGGAEDRPFIGTLDEFTVHARALRRTEVVAIWAAGAEGKCRRARL